MSDVQVFEAAGMLYAVGFYVLTAAVIVLGPLLIAGALRRLWIYGFGKVKQ